MSDLVKENKIDAGEEPVMKKAKLESLSQPPVPKQTKVVAYVTEKDVGILCYTTSGFRPIPGIVKQRFSDFQVNEIDLDGKIVRITDTEVPPLPGTPKEAEMSADNIPLKQLMALDKLSKDDNCTDKIRFPAPSCKDERKSVHMYIKAKYPSLISNCVEENGEKLFEIYQSSNPSRDDRGNSVAWPKDKTHLKFVLYKEFKDTGEAIDIISKYSGIKAQQFQYAGTKDKRARTCQLITTHKVLASKISKVNARLQGMCVGNFQYCEKPLKLGQLSGNHFRIVLREVQTNDHNMQQAVKELSTNGFINYFGMQRFGTTDIPTYEIGKCLLLDDIESAVDLIMSPRPDDKDVVRESKQVWLHKRDAEQALKNLPYSCFIERRLMQAVAKQGAKNVKNAFNTLPRNSRLLYLHSYQSLLWNKLASMRIEKFGLKPIVGDLVYTDSTTDSEENQTENGGEDSSNKENKIKHITSEDILANKYTIEDVLIPLPGYKSILPDNEVKVWLDNLLKDSNLTTEHFKSSKYKEYWLPGAYRSLLVKPKNITATLKLYTQSTDELIQSDYDLMKGKDLPNHRSGKYLAAILEFSLPSSCYATMLLREITRTDTSSRHQQTLNQKTSEIPNSL